MSEPDPRSGGAWPGGAPDSPAPRRNEDAPASGRDGEVGLIRFWYRRHAARVYRYARWRTGSRERAEAVVSDVFLEAWRSREAYDPERGSVEAWLLGIARNVVRREARRRDRREEALDPTDLERLPFPGPTPEEQAVREERRRRLLEAVWELPRADRDLVALIYGAGLSGPRAARLLETTPGAVRTRHHRILRRLREELEE